MSDVLAHSQSRNFTDFRVGEKDDCKAHEHISPDAYKVIQGLAELAAVAGGPPFGSPEGERFTLNSTGSDTLAAGSVFAHFRNQGAADATVDGQALVAGGWAVYPTDGFLNGAIPFNATGTRLFITATYPPLP